MNAKLIQFYTDVNQTELTINLRQIWDMKDYELETNHDYIQWLFPTKTPSQFHAAPLLDEETTKILKLSYRFYENFLFSIGRMLNFWDFGFSYPTAYPIALDYKLLRIKPIRKSLWWMAPRNHNKLRISRFIESCSLLGHPETALSMIKELAEFGKTANDFQIEKTTLAFWASSMR